MAVVLVAMGIVRVTVVVTVATTTAMRVAVGATTVCMAVLECVDSN